MTDYEKKFDKNNPLTKACVKLAAICHSLDKNIPYFVSKNKVNLDLDCLLLNKV